jgi:hypothetical protein
MASRSTRSADRKPDHAEHDQRRVPGSHLRKIESRNLTSGHARRQRDGTVQVAAMTTSAAARVADERRGTIRNGLMGVDVSTRSAGFAD